MPMGEMCKGMMQKPFSSLFLIAPGVVFILAGVLILVEPKVAAWLVAVACILLGAAMLMFASFVRRIGARTQGG
jgi:uncharacterized membrane protein HdeD (DUF308 family)